MAKGAGLLSVVILGVASIGWAASPRQRDRAEEQPIEDALARQDPALAAAFRAATEALDSQRLPEARAGFEKILARIPAHAASLRRLSYVAREEGKAQVAIDLARRALQAEPGRDGRFALAMALAYRGDPDALIEA